MTIAGRVATDLPRRVPMSWRGPVGSLLVSARRRQLCRARFVDGHWLHRYRDGTVVQPALGGPSASAQDRSTDELFLHTYRPGPGEVVFDLGAGTGGEVRRFSQLVGPTDHVVAVEAHPTTFDCLMATIRHNALSNVTACQYAVTSHSGSVLLEDDDHHIANGITEDTAHGIRVPAVTLPELAGRLKVSTIDLLKINIEGAERAVLESSAAFLCNVRNVVVSCHDFKADRGGADWQRTFAPVQQLLGSCGFRLTTRPTDPRPWVPFYLYGSRG